jgi:(1->4)-alpha-D-glucan 1-alpha-D-glucosylmutase
VIKAMREAKRSTSWLQPDEGVERDVVVFLERLMGDERFMAQLETFVGPLIGPGRANSLALKLAQLTSPGVPDLYQGSELWDLSLVDPDNRRPVDYTHRIGALGVLPSTAELLPRVEDDDMGLTKLFVVRRALKLRAHLPTAFGPGADHRPLVANGSHADHLVAFIRGADAITLVPRLVMGLRDGWGDTSIVLPPGTWADVFAHPDGSGSDHAVHQGEVLVGDLLSVLPVALLARVDGPTPT